MEFLGTPWRWFERVLRSMAKITSFTGFHPSWVVQDFSHQQYEAFLNKVWYFIVNIIISTLSLYDFICMFKIKHIHSCILGNTDSYMLLGFNVWKTPYKTLDRSWWSYGIPKFEWIASVLTSTSLFKVGHLLTTKINVYIGCGPLPSNSDHEEYFLF